MMTINDEGGDVDDVDDVDNFDVDDADQCDFALDCGNLGRLWSYAFKALACGPGFEFEPPWLEVEKRSDGLGSNSVDF